MSLTDDLRGVTPPLVTPFADGQVDHESLRDVIDHTVAGGVAGLFPNGTTGEFASLTDEERAAVVETTVEAAPDDVPVVAGVADTAVGAVLAHAERAADVGADAVVVTPPYFHGPNTGGDAGSEGADGTTAADDSDGLYRFFETVATEASLPVLLYDIPSCTGTPIPTETTLALAGHPNIVGLKDSSGAFTGFCTLLRETPEEFCLLQGFDAQLLPSLRMGADGGIHALSNVVPRAFADMYESAETERTDGSRDAAARADARHEAIGPLFEQCLNLGFAPGTKAALVARGVLEDGAVRPPLSPVSSEAVVDEVDAVVDQL